MTSSLARLTSQSFRYFRFFPDGRVLYSLTHQPPAKMRKLLRFPRPPAPTAWRASGKEKGMVTADVFVGSYSMSGSSVADSSRRTDQRLDHRRERQEVQQNKGHRRHERAYWGH